jgi:hypothetical protein
MKPYLNGAFAIALTSALLSSTLHAGDRGKLIFEDNFNRNESQGDKEEVGNGWFGIGIRISSSNQIDRIVRGTKETTK